MLTSERLKELLHYDPETGIFTWIVSPAMNTKAGSVAGADCEGYRLIRVNGGRYKGHRLAWLYMTGEWPALQVDHKDTNRSNNVWSNLRLAHAAYCETAAALFGEFARGA